MVVHILLTATILLIIWQGEMAQWSERTPSSHQCGPVSILARCHTCAEFPKSLNYNLSRIEDAPGNQLRLMYLPL